MAKLLIAQALVLLKGYYNDTDYDLYEIMEEDYCNDYEAYCKSWHREYLCESEKDFEKLPRRAQELIKQWWKLDKVRKNIIEENFYLRDDGTLTDEEDDDLPFNYFLRGVNDDFEEIWLYWCNDATKRTFLHDVPDTEEEWNEERQEWWTNDVMPYLRREYEKRAFW